MADLDVSEVSGKLRQLPLYVNSCPIPFDEPSCRKGMAEVLESRAASDAANPRRCPQTDRAGHPGECATDGTVLKPCTALGDEECVGATQRTEIVTPFCVVSEGRACGVFDWDEARLSELRLTNRQYSALEIHVGSVESQRLPRPQTGSCKEPDKRDMGQCPQARGRGQSSGLCHEPPDLIISEDMRFVALATGFEYPSGRNLRSWVERAQPSGESSWNPSTLVTHAVK